MVPVKRYVNGISKRPLFKGWWHLVLILLFAIVFILFVRAFLFIQVEVPAARADLDLLGGDRVVVNRISYGLRGPAVLGNYRLGTCHPSLGDLVAYDYPDRSGRISIDRVSALPGDTLWLDREEGSFTVIPPKAFGVGAMVVPEIQIMGRPVYVSYSIDASQPFYKLMRPNRLFVKIR